jgi:17beta-estradiol 17-dehydrogenase / very-long-chain 3-oxoacyl-CoA reductase
MCRTTPILSKLFTFQYNKTSFNKLKFKERYGTNCWALITGFTEGIGYAFARELAKMKYNLVLINKNDGRIESTLRWLKQIHPTIEIKVIELDFNDDSQKVYEKIYNQTNGIDIGIVINNVGISTNGDFINVERNKLLETYRINVNSQVEVSRIFIPRFKHRVNRSAFINMTSSTGIFPRPRFGLYSATKIMSDVFSRVITK